MEQANMQKAEETAVADEAWMAYVTNAWSRTVLQPLLIVIMTTALITGPLVVMQIITPDIPWRSFIAICFFVALESVYTAVWLDRPNQRSLDKAAYRAAEFIVIALIVRLLAWAFADNWPDLATWQEFLSHPLSFFTDAFFLAMLVLVFFVWQQATYTREIFADLALDAAEAAYYANEFSKHKLENRPIVTNRGHLISAFLQRWLWGGLFLVFCAALSTFDLSSQGGTWSPLAMGRLAMPAPMLTALMLYFLTGFLLLSQGRLAALNARWLINGITKGHQVERSWYRNSWQLLLIVGLAAAFLPLGSTIGLSKIVGAVVAAITAVVGFIWLLFLALIAWLLPSKTSDIALTPPPLPTTAPTPATPIPTPPPLPSAVSDVVAIVFSSAFWAVAIVMTVIAVAFFLRERNIRLDEDLLRRIWTMLANWATSLWRNLSTQTAKIREAAQSRRRAAKKPAAPKSSPWRFVRINALSPREQLRYFYLSTVRRASERGVERKPNETPLEFAQDLRENWPHAETDVESLTDAFLHARYSPQPVDKQDVGPIKQRWKRLRSNLRQRNTPPK